MRLTDEVRERIQAFIDGHLRSPELQGWLDSVADEVHADRDVTVRQLVGEVYVVLAEFDNRDRTLDSTIGELRRLLVKSREHGTEDVASTARRTPQPG